MSRVLFVNLTKTCNVECPRCYIKQAHRRGRDSFPTHMLVSALTSDYFTELETPPLVIFQGGEPQLIGRERMREICAAIREANPRARITSVSNFLACPDWFIDIIQDTFDGHVETTWAAGHKMTLGMSETGFQKAFEKSMAKLMEAGITCPINIEVNPETCAAGPSAILDLHKRTGARVFEFDLSVAFDKFWENPSFEAGNYPVLPPTSKYADVAAFMIALQTRIREEGLTGEIRSQALIPSWDKGIDHNFNVGREQDFVTMNPDGTITTNPLYSDITQTYLGSLADSSLDEILQNPMRLKRIIHVRRRMLTCTECRFLKTCGGGSSHVGVSDGSGECAGLKSLQDFVNRQSEHQKGA
jgi:radical SAM protein with 4Fe4S-binding SPASM domain